MKKFFLVLFLLLGFGFSLTPEEERQLIRDIAEIKATLKAFMREMDKRFEQVDKRFEQIDKRFEQIDKRFELVDKRITDLREGLNKRLTDLREDMNKRFEQVNQRFEELFTFLWIITGIFTTLTTSVIAFAWWDRRTIIRKAREETIDYLRREDLKKLVDVLKEKAKSDRELAEILRQYGLM